MIAKITRVLLLPAAALSLISCGGDGGQPITANSAGRVLGAINTIINGLPRDNTTVPSIPIDGATTLSKPSPKTMANIKMLATACETVDADSDLTDADGDNIATYKKSIFDCDNESSGGTTYSRAGYYTVKDLDDSVAGVVGGLTAEFNMTRFKAVTASETFDFTHKGNWTYKESGGSLVSTSKYDGHYELESTANNYKFNYDFGYTFDWKMTPADASNPWTGGTQQFSGTYSLSGDFMHESHGGDHTPVTGTWVMKYYSEGLEYQTGCSWYYSKGSIFMGDGTNTFEVRYTCTGATFYVNGAKSDLYEVENK